MLQGQANRLHDPVHRFYGQVDRSSGFFRVNHDRKVGQTLGGGYNFILQGRRQFHRHGRGLEAGKTPVDLQGEFQAVMEDGNEVDIFKNKGIGIR